MMEGRPVLLVEDEPLIRELMEDELAGAGFLPISALTGADALAEMHNVPGFLALVTDLRLPGIINGWQVGGEFRSRYPRAPIVFVTGFSEEQPADVGLSAFLRKPLSPSHVIEVLQALLRKAEADT